MILNDLNENKRLFGYYTDKSFMTFLEQRKLLDNIDFFSPSNIRQTVLGYMVQLSENNFEMLSKNKLIISVTKQLSTYLAVGLNAKAFPKSLGYSWDLNVFH